MDHTAIDQLIEVYAKRRTHASLEGLESIAGSIAISFGDFVFRVANNLRVFATGAFKDIKRSELQIVIQSNKISVARTMRLGYTVLMDVECAVYPFTLNCNTVNSYCTGMFLQLDVMKRISGLIDSYLRLAGGIKANNMGVVSESLGLILSKNMKDQLDIKESLSTMILVHQKASRMKFGEVFDSTEEYEDAVNMCLKYAHEFDTAIKIDKMMTHLYKAYDRLNEAIKYAAETNFDMGKLSGVATAIYDTGNLIESYAMLVKEAHHMDHWLSTTTVECIKKL